MKLLSLFLIAIITVPPADWQPDFETAKRVAQKEGKCILLNFSGSDWCGPCVRLKKEDFDSNSFEQFADSSLVLVNADFPRNKKNQYSKEVQQRNDALADQYNPLGKFPFTLLLTPEGKVIRSWEGYSNNSQAFLAQIKLACHDHSH